VIVLVLGASISHYHQFEHNNDSSAATFTDCSHIDMINRPVDTRQHDQGKFFHGFLPVWPLALFAIAVVFGLVAIAGLICHVTGCLTATNRVQQNRLVAIDMQSETPLSLLPDNSQRTIAPISSNVFTGSSTSDKQF
jgi:hypothetical protein